MRKILLHARALPCAVATIGWPCTLLTTLLLAPNLIFAYPPQEQNPERWFLVVEDSKVDPMSNDAPHRYKLKIFKLAGKQNRILLDRVVPAIHAKQMGSILGTIVNQFDLPPLDEKGQVAKSRQTAAQVVFLIRQFTNNRQKDVWFAGDEAERLGVQATLNRLIVITNEQIALDATDQDVREFRHAFETGLEGTMRP